MTIVEYFALVDTRLAEAFDALVVACRPSFNKEVRVGATRRPPQGYTLYQNALYIMAIDAPNQQDYGLELEVLYQYSLLGGIDTGRHEHSYETVDAYVDLSHLTGEAVANHLSKQVPLGESDPTASELVLVLHGLIEFIEQLPEKVVHEINSKY